MSAFTLETLAAFSLLVSASVFVAAFKFALREADRTSAHPFGPELPRAELHGVGMRSRNRWHHGASRQKLIRRVQVAQAVLVAIGITSVFIMFLCMAGIIGVMIVGSL